MMPFIKKSYVVSVLIWMIAIQISYAQTVPFTATWSFEGNPNGNTNNPNVGTGGANFVGIGLATGVGAGYVAGQSGQAANILYWSQSGGCNFGEYIQVSVQPLNGQTFTLTSLSFYVNHSVSPMGNTGPQSVRVRSSLDGYGSDLVQQGVSASFQQVNVGLGSSFASLANPVTFRIYACPPNGGGALRLDELTINGTVTSAPLPITLLSFTAQPEGDRVQLAWTTTSEYNADHFLVEHSRDLDEYTTVGEVAAKGTTDTRQYYGLTDLNPQPGVNYYRLKQIDRDGATQSFKPIQAIIRADEPVIAVYPNPANPDRIHFRLWNADAATVRLVTAMGQVVNGRLERQSGEADLVFDEPLPAGLYWLEVLLTSQKRVIKVLVR
ncbi:T9SS type A sorting domain-containing protein [Spirosoma telluris]